MGETVVWEAQIKANPRPTITWECDGTNVTEDDRFITDEEYKKKKYRLKIGGIELGDAGIYTITATNEMGTSSAEATLKPFSKL